MKHIANPFDKCKWILNIRSGLFIIRRVVCWRVLKGLRIDKGSGCVEQEAK